MIQDISPLVYDNAWRPEVPGAEDKVLAYSGKDAFFKTEGGEIAFPSVADYPYKDSLTYLFSISGHKYFMDESGKKPEMDGYAFAPASSSFRTAIPKENAFAGITGWQLYNWYTSRTYCGKCGRKNERSKEERMVFCPECGQMEYPKLCPAVIIGVCDGDRIVMTQYANRTTTNYALVAGFTEIGETLEETVAREVMEEVGLRVKNVRYYKSQPWSFTDTVLMGFYCDLDGDDTIRMDERELKKAVWMHRDEIPVDYQDLSLTNEMICNFAGKLPEYVKKRTEANKLYPAKLLQK